MSRPQLILISDKKSVVVYGPAIEFYKDRLRDFGFRHCSHFVDKDAWIIEEKNLSGLVRAKLLVEEVNKGIPLSR